MVFTSRFSLFEPMYNIPYFTIPCKGNTQQGLWIKYGGNLNLYVGVSIKKCVEINTLFLLGQFQVFKRFDECIKCRFFFITKYGDGNLCVLWDA